MDNKNIKLAISIIKVQRDALYIEGVSTVLQSDNWHCLDHAVNILTKEIETDSIKSKEELIKWAETHSERKV